MSTPSVYPERSQAITALVMAVAGLGIPLPIGIGAWVVANRELSAIADGRRNPAYTATARTARVVGIFGSIVFTLAATLFLLAYTGVIEVQ